MTIHGTVTEQTIDVPLKVGSRVTLIRYGGHTEYIMFEDVVKQYVPDTGLLRFERSDYGRAKFIEMLQESDGVEIREPQ